MRSSAAQAVLAELRRFASPAAVQGMERYGIRPAHALGISIPRLRTIARSHRGDHALALDLWRSGIHEARILAAFVDDPDRVTLRQMESWAKDFDSWDVCDQVCSSLFDRTAFAHAQALAWSRRPEEFVKRAGFVLMACLAVHDKLSGDREFEEFLPCIIRESADERNFVRKAVNWALRQIGKRDRHLHRRALAVAKQLARAGWPSARWIGTDARRELENVKILTRVAK